MRIASSGTEVQKRQSTEFGRNQVWMQNLAVPVTWGDSIRHLLGELSGVTQECEWLRPDFILLLIAYLAVILLFLPGKETGELNHAKQ